MSAHRVIARLDIKAPNLIKGVHLEGLRVIGNPSEYAQKYYERGIDELIYMDIVASLYNRNSLVDVIKDTTKSIFIPITVGGGIRSVQDVETILRAGGDKVAINTAAVKRPELIKEIASRFGSQCMVLSVEAKKVSEVVWEVYYDNGRERTGLDVIEWCKRSVENGAGEILLTSIDKEGTTKGFDLELVQKVSNVVSVPVIASGGAGSTNDIIDAFKIASADAVAIANLLHYDKLSIGQIKSSLKESQVAVRL
jgi:cyclase